MRLTVPTLQIGRLRLGEHEKRREAGRVYLVVVRSPAPIEVQLAAQVGDAVQGPHPGPRLGQAPALLLSHAPAGTQPGYPGPPRPSPRPPLPTPGPCTGGDSTRGASPHMRASGLAGRWSPPSGREDPPLLAIPAAASRLPAPGAPKEVGGRNSPPVPPARGAQRVGTRGGACTPSLAPPPPPSRIGCPLSESTQSKESAGRRPSTISQ